MIRASRSLRIACTLILTIVIELSRLMVYRLVLQNIGPLGHPGMPEAGYLPIPKKLAKGASRTWSESPTAE